VSRTTCRIDERGDHEITDIDAGDFGADVFDDADELVTDRADGVIRLASVVPEVRTADARHQDAYQGIGRLLEDRVWACPDADVLRTLEDRCSHRMRPLSTVAP
jgi:hypothetical protein